MKQRSTKRQGMPSLPRQKPSNAPEAPLTLILLATVVALAIIAQQIGVGPF